MDCSSHDESLDFLERTAKQIRAEGFMLYMALPGDGGITITNGQLRSHRQRIAQVLDEHEDQVLPH